MLRCWGNLLSVHQGKACMKSPCWKRLPLIPGRRLERPFGWLEVKKEMEQEGKVSSPHLLRAQPRWLRALGQALVSCQEALGNTCCVQSPEHLIKSSRLLCLAQGTWSRERQRSFCAGKPQHLPCTHSTGTAPVWDPQGLTTGQMGEKIGRDQDPDPSGACSPCVCACRSPGQSARGQSLWLLKSSNFGVMSQ